MIEKEISGLIKKLEAGREVGFLTLSDLKAFLEGVMYFSI
jgi:hypothetical protein